MVRVFRQVEAGGASAPAGEAPLRQVPPAGEAPLHVLQVDTRGGCLACLEGEAAAFRIPCIRASPAARRLPCLPCLYVSSLPEHSEVLSCADLQTLFS